MSESVAPKSCSRCGVDVAKKPRVKDPQGRYVCQDCVDKLKAAAANRKAVPPTRPGTDVHRSRNDQNGSKAAVSAVVQSAGTGDADVMNLLVQQSLEEARHGCPACRGTMKANQIICLRCGYNRETGNTLRTVEKKAVVVKEKGGADAETKNAVTMGAVVFLLEAGASAGVYFSIGNDSQAMACGAIWGVVNLATVIYLLICAFQESIFAGLCSIFVPFYQLYWVYFKNDKVLPKALFTGNFVGTVIYISVWFSYVMDVMTKGFVPLP